MTSDELLARAKRKLNITWSDEGTDARVRDAIDAARPRLAHLLGLDGGSALLEQGEELGLLMEAVFYAFNDAADEFAENYAADILRVRMKHEARDA
ncbi:hypothetical protein JI75_02570 [Berryella intestinalis]|uniref:Uncharacterized protein n=1 Tax=Berryella intestinalis TaxID=1531429 RepID=A0A0A8B4H7_9ACTN|nr:hypothetical protein [Berryella intestinalis]AJC11718.1 hypothetical protein JI75_02570 [Berryella intestinalis]